MIKTDENKLVEDIFTVNKLDPDNKTPFRNVSRVHLTSEYDLEMELDINTQIYPVALKMKLFVKTVLSKNARNAYNKEELAKISERDNFEYVMYGVVFELEEPNDNEMIVYASFGGLIMKLRGKKAALAAFRKEGAEARFYLLIRKA